jgi:glycine dehydrogenase subunit 1
MPNSAEKDKATMMAALGITTVEELFEQVPRDHYAKTPIDIPDGLRSEVDVNRHVRDLLRRNRNCADTINFLGGGYWQHYVPAICDEIAGRSEFLTSVWGTPSSDHGRNQAWFEFASLLGALLDLEFVGLPVYSWGAAAGFAVRMATRMTGRNRVLLVGPMDPERLAVIRNYCIRQEGESPIDVVEIGYDQASGQADLSAVQAALSDDTAAVYLESPNFLGRIETQLAGVARIAREAGAETVVGVDPLSLGVLTPPSRFGADIVVGTTQPLGIHLHGGGGVGGFIATRDEERYAREYPTLQVSICDTKTPGERAFGMTLFHQSSYGSRENGNDWTGNSVYLWTVVNAVYMALLGPVGFRELGETILAGSHFASERLSRVPGLAVLWQHGFFKEFVVRFDNGMTVDDVNARLRERGIFGGKDLSADFPELGQAALFCVTEVHTEQDIEALVAALTEVLT